MSHAGARIEFTDRVPQLPDKGSRAEADRIEVLEYGSYETGGWEFREWRLRASGVKSGVSLEGWWSPADAAAPIVGRIRIKRSCSVERADLGELDTLARPELGRPGLTQILNIELEPAFVGQGLGLLLIRAALADVPGDEVVVCEPVPSEYSNVPSGLSVAAVSSFYMEIGLTEDDRLSGYLTAKRSDLVV